MDDITPEEYERVLKFMEAVNEQNFQKAVGTMKRHEFNLEVAINNHFQPAAASQHHRPHHQQDDEEIVRKYVDFLRKKNEEWNIFAVVIDIIRYILFAIFNFIAHLLPEQIYTRLLGSAFERTYAGKLKNKYNHSKLSYYLPKTKNLNAKSVLLVVSPKQEHPAIPTFLNDQSIDKKVRQSFFLTCYTADSKELSIIDDLKESPQVIALRWNIFEEVTIIGRSYDPKNITAQLLEQWAHEGRNLFKRDGNVLVKYRNYIARFHGIYYEEEEEEEVNLVQRNQEKHQIHQQNQAYKLVEEETRRSKEAERERLKKQAEEERVKSQLLEERKIRKMSIPDEPTSGEIIRLSFRCPNGSTIFRNFQANEKIQLIFHWVELNEEIEFQDENRHFQIMYSYPPSPLSNKKDSLLSDVFDSSQEKVVIRQL